MFNMDRRVKNRRPGSSKRVFRCGPTLFGGWSKTNREGILISPKQTHFGPTASHFFFTEALKSSTTVEIISHTPLGRLIPTKKCYKETKARVWYIYVWTIYIAKMKIFCGALFEISTVKVYVVKSLHSNFRFCNFGLIVNFRPLGVMPHQNTAMTQWTYISLLHFETLTSTLS